MDDSTVDSNIDTNTLENISAVVPGATPYVRSLSEELAQAEQELKEEMLAVNNLEADRSMQSFFVDPPDSQIVIEDSKQEIFKSEEPQPLILIDETQVVNTSEDPKQLLLVDETPVESPNVETPHQEITPPGNSLDEDIDESVNTSSSTFETKDTTNDLIEIEKELSVVDSKPFVYSTSSEKNHYCCPDPPTHTSNQNKKRKAGDTVDGPSTTTTIEVTPSATIELTPSTDPTHNRPMVPMTSVAIQTRFTIDSGTNTDDLPRPLYYPANQVQSPVTSINGTFEQISLDIVEQNVSMTPSGPNQSLAVKDEPDVAIATALTVGTALVSGASAVFRILRFVLGLIPWSTVLNVISGVSTVVTGLETVQTILYFIRRIPLIGRLFKPREQTATGPVSVETQTFDPNHLPLSCLQCGRCLKDLPCCPVCSVAPGYSHSISQLVVPVINVSPGPSSPRRTSVSLVVEQTLVPQQENTVDPSCVVEAPPDQIAQESRVVNNIVSHEVSPLPITSTEETTIDNCQRGEN